MSVASASEVDAAILAALQTITTGNGYPYTVTVYNGITGRNLLESTITLPACGLIWTADNVVQAADKGRGHQREYSIDMVYTTTDALIQTYANDLYFSVLKAFQVGAFRELNGIAQFIQLEDLTAIFSCALQPRAEGSEYSILSIDFSVSYKALRA